MKIGGTLGLGSLDPIAVERPPVQPAVGVLSRRIEDPITLSSAARSREAAAMHPRFGELSATAHRDADLGEQLAYNYSHNPMHQLVDARDEIAGTGPLKYAATGEPVTPESEARYRKMAESLQTASLALYNEERAKGTSSADIFDKLIALGDAQSAEFRGMVDWEGRTAGVT